MAFKFVAFLAFVAVASAGVLPVPQVYHPAPAAPVVAKSITPAIYVHAQPLSNKYHEEHSDSPAHYKFAYEVNDEHTGDNHSQQEERDGDVVHGEYSLIDADGFRRVVQYTVDPHSGFNAVVNRIPLAQHAKVIAVPTHYVAPAKATTVVKEYPIPVAYHQHH